MPTIDTDADVTFDIESPLQGLRDRLEGLRPVQQQPDPRSTQLVTPGSAFADITTGLGVWLRTWRTTCLPPFIEGTAVDPPKPGWLRANPLPRGGFSYTGEIDATSAAQPVLAYSRWRSQKKLPAAPMDAWLLYRFQVHGAFGADFAGASAVVSHTVNVGVAPDSTKMPPFFAPEWERTREAGVRDSGSALSGAARLAASGTAVIEGSVRVAKGDIPEIAVLLSTDILLNDAWIDFTHVLGGHSRISGVEFGGDGCLEYRYVSTALISELAEARVTQPFPALPPQPQP
jgi:hypothetical protein